MGRNRVIVETSGPSTRPSLTCPPHVFAEVDLLLAALLPQGEVVAGVLQLPGVTRDPACAVEGGAGYLVSGHRDLLDLGEHEGI